MAIGVVGIAVGAVRIARIGRAANNIVRIGRAARTANNIVRTGRVIAPVAPKVGALGKLWRVASPIINALTGINLLVDIWNALNSTKPKGDPGFQGLDGWTALKTPLSSPKQITFKELRYENGYKEFDCESGATVRVREPVITESPGDMGGVNIRFTTGEQVFQNVCSGSPPEPEEKLVYRIETQYSDGSWQLRGERYEPSGKRVFSPAMDVPFRMEYVYSDVSFGDPEIDKDLQPLPEQFPVYVPKPRPTPVEIPQIQPQTEPQKAPVPTIPPTIVPTKIPDAVPIKQPDPKPFPKPTPRPGPAPSPQPEPKPTPLPEPAKIPTPTPIKTPTETQPLTNDAKLPAPKKPPVQTTNKDAHVFGKPGNKVTGQTSSGTLPQIGKEVGRIEQKLAQLGSGKAGPDYSDFLPILKAIYDYITNQKGGTTYELQAFCECPEDEDNCEEPKVTKTTPGGDYRDETLARIDAIAQLLQPLKTWKQPICEEKRPEQKGSWVTAQWESEEPSSESNLRLRKLTRYRSLSGRSDEELADYFCGFTWDAGPVCVIHKDAWWGVPQVWASNAAEGKRVIRFLAGEAGFDPDTEGKWLITGSKNPRFGRTGKMVLRLKAGYPWVSSRDGSNFTPMG